jgi:Flp pilus assembly protein TadD/TolB-like protein
MINREGRVKILDFGLAKLQEDHPSPNTEQTPDGRLDLTLEGALMGTVPYMSPEQIRQAPMDHRSDLFALGTTLYEMATGKKPFTGKTLDVVTRSILQETPRPLTEQNPDLHPELERIVTHCLRKDPDDRYQTAKGLRNELEELRLTIRSRELPSHAAREKLKPYRWQVLAAAGAVLVLVTTALILDRMRPPAVSPVHSVEKHLVVIPFTALGDQEVPTALTLGLAETLTARLSRLTDTHNLQIAHAAQGAGEPVSNVDEAGRHLGVNLAIVGSVQQYDPDLRVAVQLIDVQDNRQLGGQVIHATLDNPFDLQDRIVAAAIGMLELELQPREEQELQAHGTGVAEAERLYLKGRGYLMDYSDPRNIDQAIEAFRLAIREDAGYAEAHAGLGSAYWYKYEHTMDAEWVEEAFAACRRSVTLNETQAAGRNCLGTALVGTGQYLEAAVEFRMAADLEPTSDEAFRGLGSAYQSLGHFEKAEETYRQAITLRPHYWATHNWLGAFYVDRGRLDEAAASFRKVTELVPTGYRGYQNLGGVFLLQGRFEDALPVLEKSVALKPSAGGYSNLATTWFALRQFEKAVRFNLKAIEQGTRDFSVWGNLAEAYYWAEGDTEKTRQAYRKAVELAQAQLQVNRSDTIALGELAKYHAMQGDEELAIAAVRNVLDLDPDNADTQLSAAIVYATLDRTDEALDQLENSRKAGMTSGWITAHPVFDKLSGNDRFQKLVEEVKRRES